MINYQNKSTDKTYLEFKFLTNSIWVYDEIFVIRMTGTETKTLALM